MLANPYQSYQAAQMETASPGKLLLMLYDGALRFLTQAQQAMEQKNWQDAHNFILRAEDIITELMSTLKLDMGPIPQNLYRLYEYMNWRLLQANIKRNPEGLIEVQERLRELREAWVEAIKQQATGSGNVGGTT